MIKNEGFGVLYRGYLGFLFRVVAATTSQVITFDFVKNKVMEIRGIEEMDFLSRLCGVLVAGYFVTLTCLPFDNIKMKMMKMIQVEGKDGVKRPLYSGFTDCM